MNRVLLALGGGLLAAQALLPTYRAKADPISPVGVFVGSGEGAIVSWIILVPHLLGLAVALSALSPARGAKYVEVHRVVATLLLLVVGIGAGIGIMLVLVLLVTPHLWTAETGIFVFAESAYLFFTIAAIRAFRSRELATARPAVRVLVYQAMIALCLGLWLIPVLIDACDWPEEAIGAWVGAAGWALTLVGAHVGARAERRVIDPPTGA